MEVSSKFKFIEVNLVKLFTLIYENQNIAKYVYNLSDNPLDDPLPHIDLLKEGYYFLNLFDGSIPDKHKIRLFINPVVGNLNRYPLSDIVYLLEIVLPNKFIVLNGRGELRCIRILDEIAQMIDQKKVAGITDAEIPKFRVNRIPNSDYCVYSAEIIVNSSTLKGLR